ncbi:MAG TPA: hypothetical protein VGG03_26120 [Thermoanaerobaculia bacterium]
MRNKRTFGDKISNWKVTGTNMAPHLQEMPHLQAIHTELQAVIAEAEAHDAEQETARGRLRELTAKRREIERRGERLRARVAAHLKGTFGYTSEQLIQFGLNPLKTVGRKRPERKKKSAEAPAPPQTPPAQ